MLAAMLFTVAVNAQSSFVGTSSNPTNAITNTSVDTLSFTSTFTYEFQSIQVVVTKATGTMAGTSTLYQSVDGVNYVALGTPLTLSNVTTNTVIWNTNVQSRYWRIITGGATTVTGSVSAKISFTRQ